MYYACLNEWRIICIDGSYVCIYVCMYACFYKSICIHIHTSFIPTNLKISKVQPYSLAEIISYVIQGQFFLFINAVFSHHFSLYVCMYVCVCMCVSINECSVCTLAFHGTINLSTVSSIFVNEAKLCTGKWAKITLFNSYTTQLKIALLLYKNTIYWDEICNYARCNGMPYTAIHN
jgi:hypothetical protein